MPDNWPTCGDDEPGTRDSCRLLRGHPGLHRSLTGSWGSAERRLEDAEARIDLAVAAERARIRAAIDLTWTASIGPKVGLRKETIMVDRAAVLAIVNPEAEPDGPETCPTCHRVIVNDAHGGPHPSPGDHDSGEHVLAAYGSKP